MLNGNANFSDSTIILAANVDIREEHFGSLIYRAGRFDFLELNHFGTLIGRLIQKSPTTINHLSKRISHEYSRSVNEVHRDLNNFLNTMINKGFMKVDESVPALLSGKSFHEIIESLEESWDGLREQNYYSGPLQFHWEITHQCNLRCMHCYASSAPVRNDEVDTINWDEYMALLKTLRNMKVVQINFLGGEPLIEMNFLPLLEKAWEYGFDVTFPSNGLLFTREKLERLKACGMEFITISLDSADPAIFEKLRGMEGIFPKVLHNIRLVKEMGMGVVINTVLTRMTIDGFQDLIELLIKLKVDILKVIDEFPVGRGLTNMDRLLLTPEDYHHFYVTMIRDIEPMYRDRLEIKLSPRFAIRQELEKNRKIGCGSPNNVKDGEGKGEKDGKPGEKNQEKIKGSLGENTVVPVDYRCSAGRSQCFCTADWDIYPCYLFYGERDFSPGNLLGRPFDDIWNDPGSFECFRVRMGSIPECKGCEFRENCKGGCRGDAYKFTKDFFAGNPYCWNLNTGD